MDTAVCPGRFAWLIVAYPVKVVRTLRAAALCEQVRMPTGDGPKLPRLPAWVGYTGYSLGKSGKNGSTSESAAGDACALPFCFFSSNCTVEATISMD